MIAPDFAIINPQASKHPVDVAVDYLCRSINKLVVFGMAQIFNAMNRDIVKLRAVRADTVAKKRGHKAVG